MRHTLLERVNVRRLNTTTDHRQHQHQQQQS